MALGKDIGAEGDGEGFGTQKVLKKLPGKESVLIKGNANIFAEREGGVGK